ncbi:O-fucosyltransferase 15-like isoform X4 [Dioscorea cayenensis subsp. rotundata]|uniref:O-fucosyltransferase family protein n=1 Tax=Dioscorea cayennensis subsp. rotundata TaxID=55577 RepID=A0AB40B585_DIOCR|nr:O-fucosyltransferase 15-like isoform X4 [Dioscorea cayenensis subsp. rotundata]
MASGITPLELHLHPLPTPQEEIQEEELSPSSSAPSAGASSFLPRSHSTTPRHQLHGSPRSFGSGDSSPFPLLGSSRFSHPHLGSESSWRSLVLRWWSQMKEPREKQRLWLNRRKGWQRRRARGVAAWIAVVGFFFLMNWRMFSRLQESSDVSEDLLGFSNSSSSRIVNNWSNNDNAKKPGKVMFTRLLAVAAHALAEREKRPEPPDLWKETLISSSLWTPCANQRNWRTSEGSNGYLLISANGGINQQRVAELPMELQSLDLEAIGSVVTDAEVMKEAKPSIYLKKILPILLKNSVVHIIGFGNRLAFDPIPFELQRLRCRCNFHALQFVQKIQETGALLVQRMRNHRSHWKPIEQNLFGQFAAKTSINEKKSSSKTASRYLAVHLRFEIDMAAYSMCYFGGGKDEEEELEAYRAIHFPALTLIRNTTKVPSAAFLRSEGQCPLTPEESVLMLVALGFKRKTRVYLAGANIYGGKSRMAALTSLYPHLVTKESLLSSSEISPFLNFSSQLAALDFIVCAAADAFAMTDSGSQFSSLVSGYRMYYGGGKLPTIRPNKRRLANIFLKNNTIEWKTFEQRVRKTVRQTKQVDERPVARSVYRHPRTPACMCRTE